MLLKTLLKAGLLPFLAWILLYVEREAPSFARISFDPEYDYVVGRLKSRFLLTSYSCCRLSAEI